MPKAKTYYSLFVRDGNGFLPQFGDYVRSCVAEEMKSYREDGHKAKDMRIIGHDDALSLDELLALGGKMS